MGIPVLILGESGSGKSTSMRNFNQDEVGVFNVGSKPFPFRKQLPTVNGAGYQQIFRGLAKPTRRTYVIDDSQFLMADQYFDNINTTDTYGLFKSIGTNFRALVKYINEQLPADIIVYFLHHVEVNANGFCKAKTVGKLLDDKDTVEGRFAVVLLCKAEKGRNYFVTQSMGVSTAKSPMDMFELEIDNDLKFVDTRIRDYWGLSPVSADDNKKEGETV